MFVITDFSVVQGSDAKKVTFTATVQEIVFLSSGVVTRGSPVTRTGTIDFDDDVTTLQTVDLGG